MIWQIGGNFAAFFNNCLSMRHSISVFSSKRPVVRGYVLGCVASCSYGLNPLFAKPLYRLGFDVPSVLLYRYVLAAIILAALMAIKGQPFALSRRELPALLSAGALFALSSLTLFSSYNYMDVGVASTILYITPVFVAIIMAVRYGQRLSPVAAATIVIAIIGIAMLSTKDGGEVHNPLGIALVAMSALTYAIYMVIINRSGVRNMPTLKLTFYSITVGIAVFLVFIFGQSRPVALPVTLEAWADITGLALFPTIVSIVTMTIAIQDIGPMPTSILEALEPVTAIFVGCLAFGEVLTPLNIGGVVLVVGAVTVMVAWGAIKQGMRRLAGHDRTPIS